jgi:hypothetical protein
VLRSGDRVQVATAVTDSAGVFELKITTSEICLLAVSHIGYTTVYSPTFNTDTASLQFEIQLNNKTTELAKVEVNRLTPVIERKLDRVVVTVENNIVASGESVMELLKTLPGIVVDGSGNVSVKGKADIRVMIDGHETYQKEEQLKLLLAGMSASTIKKVEIISNPPAKYAAEGAGGIINLITKSRELSGVTGNLYASHTQGIYGRTAAGGLVSCKTKRLLLTGSYDLTHAGSYRDGEEVRRFNQLSPVETFYQVSSHPSTIANHYYKAGLDWTIARNQSISVTWDGALSKTYSPYNSMLRIFHDPAVTDSSFSINNLTASHYNNNNLNTDYTLHFDTLGQTLQANYSRLQYNTHATNSYYSLFFDSNGDNPRAPQPDTSYNKARITVDAYKLDYKRGLPFAIQLEAGAKYTSAVTDNDIAFFTLKNGAYETDSSRSNHFIYTENSTAGYLSARKNFRRWDMQLGLRYEDTRAKLNLATNNLVIYRHLHNLFPSLFLEYRISDNHRLNFTSGRRIRRPDYAALNPFAFYYDPFSYSKGNPYLLPQYTFSNEITYSYKSDNSITLGYSVTNNLINEITVQYDTAKTVAYQYENINSSRSLYGEVYMPWNFAPWWNATADVNVSYTAITGNASYGVFANRLTSVTLSYNNTITFAKLYTAQVNMLYYSPFADGVSVFKSRGRLSLGLRRSFYKKSLTVALRVTDLLFTDKERVKTTSLNQDIYLRQTRDTRRVGITLTYNFKKGAKFNERKVGFGGEEEKNRIGVMPKTF